MPKIDTFVHWPVLAFIVLGALGYSHIVDHPLNATVLRRYRFSWIDFLIFLFGLGVILSQVTLYLRPSIEHRSSIPLLLLAYVALGAALILIIWQEVRFQQPRPVTFHRSTAAKCFLTLYVLGIPLFIVAHVLLVQPKKYVDKLSFYRQIYGIEEPEYITAEPNPNLRELYNAMPALNFYYLQTQPISLPPIDASMEQPKQREIQHFVNGINEFRGSILLFATRLVLYVVVLFLLLRYVGLRIEVLQAQHARDYRGLGLEEDVISKVSAFGAAIISLILALALSGFSFGEIGIFGGLVAAGVSVALRDVLANLMAGVILSWDRTISKNDVITLPASTSNDVGSTYGIVKAMTLRYTMVEERNTVSRLIPNSLLINETVENWTKSGDLVRLAVNIGVDYKADPRRVKAILESVCYEVDRVSMEKRPQALITSFADSSVIYALRFWVKNPKEGIRPVLSAVYFHILERFADEGVSIAFPQLDLHIKTLPGNNTETAPGKDDSGV